MVKPRCGICNGKDFLIGVTQPRRAETQDAVVFAMQMTRNVSEVDRYNSNKSRHWFQVAAISVSQTGPKEPDSKSNLSHVSTQASGTRIE